MSFANFLKSAIKKKKKKPAPDASELASFRMPAGQLTPAEMHGMFEQMCREVENALIDLKLAWQRKSEDGVRISNESSESTMRHVCLTIDKMVSLLVRERTSEHDMETPPCYEVLLKRDVVTCLSRFATENLGLNFKVNANLIFSVADIILFVPGSRDRPLIGYYAQTTEPILQLLRQLHTPLARDLEGIVKFATDGSGVYARDFGETILLSAFLDAELHYAFLYLVHALCTQLSAYPNCGSFFYADGLSIPFLDYVLPYVASELVVGSGAVIDKIYNVDPNKELFLSDLAIEVLQCLCCVLSDRVASCLNESADYITGLVMTTFRTLLDDALGATTEAEKATVAERLASRLRLCDCVGVGVSPALRRRFLDGYARAIGAKFTETIRSSPAPGMAQSLLTYFLENLTDPAFLAATADAVVADDACVASLIAQIRAKETTTAASALRLCCVLLQKRGERTHEALISRHLPSNPSLYDEGGSRRYQVNSLFHPLVMRPEYMDQTLAQKDATSTVASQTLGIDDTYKDTAAGLGLPGGILLAATDRLKDAGTLPTPVLVALLAFLTQVLLCGVKSSSLFFFWGRGPIVKALLCVKDGIEAWCLENGERQTREHALRARGTLGIQQQDAGNRLRRTKSLRSAGSMYKVLDARQTRAFEAWAVLDEWRVELLAVVEALDDLSLARNVGRGPQRKPQSALVRKPSLPPSILATPPPSVKRVPSTV